MAKVFYRSAARRDLIAHYIYLADNANEATAERFLTNAEASFHALSIHPKMGAPLTLRHPDLQKLRKWHVDDFDKFLIFYFPRRNGVSIVRVLHAHKIGGHCWILKGSRYEGFKNEEPATPWRLYPNRACRTCGTVRHGRR